MNSSFGSDDDSSTSCIPTIYLLRPGDLTYDQLLGAPCDEHAPHTHVQLPPTQLELRREGAKRMLHELRMLHERSSSTGCNNASRAAEARRVWLDLMCDFQFIKDPHALETAANTCTVECMQQQTTLRLVPSLHLYGCWLHGTLHECECTSRTCKIVFTDVDLNQVCVLSRRSLGFATIAHSDSTYRTDEGSDGMSRYKYVLSAQHMNSLRDSFCNSVDSAQQIEKRAAAYVDAASVDSTASYLHLERDKFVERVYDDLQAQLAPAAEPAVAKARVQPAAATAKQARGAASEHRVVQAKRESEARARQTIAMVIHDLLQNRETRSLYNEFTTKSYKATLTRIVDEHILNAQRDRTMPNASHILTAIANETQRVEELLVETSCDTQAVDRNIQSITALWKVCFGSPYAKQCLDSPSTQRKLTALVPSPVCSTQSAPTVCTLRQFTLGCLYSLCSGVYVTCTNISTVGDSGTRVCALAPNESLGVQLPPRDKIVYFGDTAFRVLRMRVAKRLFGPPAFDPLDDFVRHEEAADAAASRVDTAKLLASGTTSAGRSLSTRLLASMDSTPAETNGVVARLTGAHTDDASRSEAKSKSDQLAADLRNSQSSSIQHNTRKRRRQVDVAPIVHAARDVGSQHLSRSGGGGRYASLVPAYMREPLLNGPGHLVYSELDVERGMNFMRACLDSYGPSLPSVLNKF